MKDIFDEVSGIIATTTYKSITIKGELSQQVVDVRKVIEILKEKYIITKK